MLLAARFATPITVPGPRLLHEVPLRFIRARKRPGRTIQGLDVALTPLCDSLLCLVVFLLTRIMSPSACPHQRELPSAVNVRKNVEAPVVAVTSHQVLLDGVPIAEAAVLVGSTHPALVPPLREMLRAKRELWRELNPAREFPGVAVLQVDRDVPALSVKSVFRTAVAAGYPNVSFLVWQRSGPARP